MHYMGEQALKVGTMIGGVAQDVHRIRLHLEQVGKMRADNRIGVKLIEGSIDFKLRLSA